MTSTMREVDACVNLTNRGGVIGGTRGPRRAARCGGEGHGARARQRARRDDAKISTERRDDPEGGGSRAADARGRQ